MSKRSQKFAMHTAAAALLCGILGAPLHAQDVPAPWWLSGQINLIGQAHGFISVPIRRAT